MSDLDDGNPFWVGAETCVTCYEGVGAAEREIRRMPGRGVAMQEDVDGSRATLGRCFIRENGCGRGALGGEGFGMIPALCTELVDGVSDHDNLDIMVGKE